MKMEDIPMDMPPEFAYLLSKAQRYLKVGPETYRAADYFNMPNEDWQAPLLAAVKRGMEQICRYKGYLRDNPFEDLGVDGFRALLSTLHFEMEQQSALKLDDSSFLDEMHMRHRMTGQTIVLFNRIASPNPG